MPPSVQGKTAKSYYQKIMTILALIRANHLIRLTFIKEPNVIGNHAKLHGDAVFVSNAVFAEQAQDFRHQTLHKVYIRRS